MYLLIFFIFKSGLQFIAWDAIRICTNLHLIFYNRKNKE